MTAPTLVRPREGRASERAGLHADATATARGHLHRALDVAELLVADVLVPTVAADPTADTVKECAEVAMLLRAASRLDDPAARERVARTADLLAPLARSPEVLRRLAHRASSSAPLALAHACLTESGHGDETVDAHVRAAFGAAAARAGDRTAYRILDVAWIRHLVLGDVELREHPVLPLTCLAVGVDLLDTSTEEAYAYSHTLPYATDFGRLPLPAWVDGRLQSDIADALIAKALSEDDLDLLGELLMAPTLLRRPWTPTQEFAWHVLVQVWQRHPILPGPGIPPATGPETGLEQRRRVLGTAYHTSLVGGLLMATTLTHGQPPSPLAVDPGDLTETSPVWATEWARLAADERERLRVVPTLLALREALVDLDLARALGILRGPSAAELPTALLRQSVELVQRVAAHD